MISGESASSAMISPSTISVGSAYLINSTALRTFVQIGMIDAAEAGERKHGHAGNQVESPRHMCRAQRDFDQIFRGGLDVDAGIGQEEDLPFARDDGVAAGDAVQPLAHANNLQRRADRVRDNAG